MDTRHQPQQLTLITETLRLPRPDIATVTDQGLVISEDATESDLLALGARLFAVRSWTKWGLGSVFAAMLKKRPHPDFAGHPGEYDTGWVSDFADAHRLDPKERRELIGVCLFYGGASPTPHLSFEHHREAMWGAASFNASEAGGITPLVSSRHGGASPRSNSAPTPAAFDSPTHPTETNGGASFPTTAGAVKASGASLAAGGVVQPDSGGRVQSGHGHLLRAAPTTSTAHENGTPPGAPALVAFSTNHAATPAHAAESFADSRGSNPPPEDSSARGVFATPAHAAATFQTGGASRNAAVAYLRTAEASGMTLTQLRAHIRASQRTEQPVQREIAIAAYSAVFDFHRFAARELAAIADLKPERARMILADLGQESLDFLAALQRVAANTHAR